MSSVALPHPPRDMQDTKARDGWFRAVASELVPGLVRGDPEEVARRREDLARLWADAQRRGDDLASLATTALLVVQDGVLGDLAALEHIRLARDSVAARLLQAVADSPGSGQTELAEQVGAAEATVSREGARLEDQGLVVRRRVGRQRLWELTPRGHQAVERLAGPRLAPPVDEVGPQPQAATSPHLEALIAEEQRADMREVPESLRESSTAAMFASVA